LAVQNGTGRFVMIRLYFHALKVKFWDTNH